MKNIAKILERSARDSDEVFRWGGEEFLVLLSNSDQKQAYEISERIRKEIEKSVTQAGKYKIKCTMSFGLCEYQLGFDEKEIIKCADDQLYIAKRTGRNKVCFAPVESR